MGKTAGELGVRRWGVGLCGKKRAIVRDLEEHHRHHHRQVNSLIAQLISN